MKATKRLIGAVVALVAALAVSVGATFAWFTTQNTAKVNAFEVSVRDATGNLSIGLSAESLSQAPLTIDTSTGAYTNLKLKDVTSEDGVTINDKEESPATANTDYFKLELFFMSTTAVKVYLAEGSQVVCSSPNATNDLVLDTAARAIAGSKYGQDVSTNGKLTTNAANAARVSFVDTATGKIWEPNANQGFHEKNLAEDYEKYIKGGATSWSVTDEPTNVPATPAISSADDLVAKTATSKDVTTKTELFSLEANVAKKITINIWIEGKDGDCLNSIFADKIATTLEFVAIEAGAGA